MIIGKTGWIETIEDDEAVTIYLKTISRTQNDKPFIKATTEKGDLFYANVGEKHAQQLREDDYYVMKCTGHSDKGYPYLNFEEVEIDPMIREMVDVANGKYTKLYEKKKEAKQQKPADKQKTLVDPKDAQWMDDLIDNDMEDMQNKIKDIIRNINANGYTHMADVKDKLVEVVLDIERIKMESDDYGFY